MNTCLSVLCLLLCAAIAQAGTIATVECYTEVGEIYVVYFSENDCRAGPSFKTGLTKAEARYSADATHFDIRVLGEARPGQLDDWTVQTSAFSEVTMNYQLTTAGPLRPGFLELAIGAGADWVDGEAAMRGQVGDHRFEAGRMTCSGCGDYSLPVTLGAPIDVQLYALANVAGNSSSAGSNVAYLDLDLDFFEAGGSPVESTLIDPDATALIPEPLSWLLMASGLSAMAWLRRRWKM
ncbi:MAG: PEP-CTERM sorting domain-containing protein [Bryobacteraceae bacterium]